MIEQNCIENLKQRLDIVEVVGHYLELKRSGASFKAVCPFHDDSNPSLHVSPAKQMYHCFVCEAGGDAINFVREYEKLNYPETIERLASMYNFSLTYTQNDQKNSNQKKILEMLELHYQKCLSQNIHAKEYLKERGIFNSSIEKFSLGYAPDSANTLSFLQQSGATMSECKEVGVADIGQNGRGYARFIERIIFPIHEQNGRVVGFGGRTITNHPAKYVNSPQTKLFNKSRLLYGYHKAKQDIYKQKNIIITEGYLDVIMLHQAGFTTAVATLGTALTNEHIPLITRGEPKVILSYDGDMAGITAAFKASKMLSAHSIEGGVVIFNGGLDPADMVKSGQSDKLSKLFSNPKPFAEFCLEHIVKNYNLADPLQKQKALHVGLEYLNSLPKLIASSYKGLFADMLGVKENFVKVAPKKTQIKAERRFEDLGELTIIKTLLQTPSLIDTVLDTIDPSMFKVHFEEFSLLLNNKLESPTLRRILMLDDVKAYSEEELKTALRNLLISHYHNELKKVRINANISYQDKSFLIQKIQNILFKLKKGEWVTYESFSTI